MDANFAIVLTPTGSGAIAVIRLVGPRVGEFLIAHFSGTPKPGRCAYGNLEEGDRVIDDAVVVIADSWNAADLNIHGGVWVVRSVLELAGRLGFTLRENSPAEPVPLVATDGEDLLEQEMLAALPLARTEFALRMLLGQPAAWRNLVQAIPNLHDRKGQLKSILADRSLDWLLHPPTIAIVGAPNVGKSTLANQLFGQERSITADLPGTTRDWIQEAANLDGLAVTLLDTPGVRVTDDAIEHAAIQQARSPVAAADLVILILDASQPLDSQQELIDSYPSAIQVINKVDRSIGWHTAHSDAMTTIAATGDGVDALCLAIRDRFIQAATDFDRPRCWTDRQRTLLLEES